MRAPFAISVDYKTPAAQASMRGRRSSDRSEKNGEPRTENEEVGSPQRRNASPSERMLDSEPELQRRVAVERLGEVNAEHRPFNDAQPLHVDAQAEADGLGRVAQGMAAEIGVADVVKGGE